MTAKHRKAQKLAKTLLAKFNAALTAAHDLNRYMEENDIVVGPHKYALIHTCEMDEAIQGLELVAEHNGWTLESPEPDLQEKVS